MTAGEEKSLSDEKAMKSISAYQKAYQELKREIKEGIYKPGMSFPTETELQKKFSVSRTTIRKTIELLSQEGYLKTRQGKGTEFLDISVTQRLNYITSITETLISKGYHVTAHNMSIEAVPAQAEAAKIFGSDTPVYRIQRTQYADDLPIAIMLNYLNCKAVPGLERYANCFTSLYRFLEDKYKIRLKYATQKLLAINASVWEAELLKIPVGSPLLCSKRVSYTENDSFEYSVIKLLADKYEYSVYLHGRP